MGINLSDFEIPLLNGQTFNRVETLIENPCEEPWEVYLELAKPAAKGAVMELAQFPPGEITEEVVEQKYRRARGGRRGRTRRSRRSTRYGTRRSPNVRSMRNKRGLYGAVARGVRRITPTIEGPGTAFAFRAFNVIERGLWYWQVLDVADSFIANWHSQMFESRFCSEALDYSLSAEFGPWTESNALNVPREATTVISSNNMGTGGGTFTFDFNQGQGVKADFVAQCEFSNPLNRDYRVEMSLSELFVGSIAHTEGTLPANGTKTLTLTGSHTFNNDCHLICNTRSDAHVNTGTIRFQGRTA